MQDTKINNVDLARFFGLRLVDVNKWEIGKPNAFKALVFNYNKEFLNKELPRDEELPSMQDISKYFGFSRNHLYNAFRYKRPEVLKALILYFMNNFEGLK